MTLPSHWHHAITRPHHDDPRRTRTTTATPTSDTELDARRALREPIRAAQGNIRALTSDGTLWQPADLWMLAGQRWLYLETGPAIYSVYPCHGNCHRAHDHHTAHLTLLMDIKGNPFAIAVRRPDILTAITAARNLARNGT